MTQYLRAVNEGVRHDRHDHRRRSPQVLMPGFLMLTLLGFVPLTARAAEPPNPLCTNCHNADGNSTNPEYPKLAGLDAWYIAKQIRDFKNGKRFSEAMGPMAEKIAEADIGNLAAYYSGQKPTPGIVTDRRLAAQGQAIYDDGVDSTAVPACAGCHEKDGSGSKKFPRLAGQHTAYLINQLNNFRTGVRNNEPRMRSVVRRLTDQEIVAVAEYIAGLKGGEK
jgi:cytochrome c553